jgi:hypothetical protein
MQGKLSSLKLFVISAGVGATVALLMSNSSVFASHSFQLGVAGDYVPSKTLTHTCALMN